MTFIKLTKYLIILSLIPAIYYAFFPGKIVLITVICSYPLIFPLIYFSKKSNKSYIDGKIYISLFIIYSIILFLRGIMNVKSHYDLGNLLTDLPIYLILPFTIYIGAYTSLLMTVIRTFFNYILPLSLILIFVPETYRPLGFAHTVSPIYLAILFMPYMKRKYSFFVITVAIIAVLHDLTVRTNIINTIASLLIVMTFVFHKYQKSLYIIKIIRILLIFSPLVFVILSITGVFNVFEIQNFSNKTYTVMGRNDNKRDLLVDSRTSIYSDVFLQLYSSNAYYFGLGADGKTRTSLTDLPNTNFSSVYKGGRPGTESGMLNYIQWGGVLGFAFYYLLFITSSYYGIFKSNNWLCKMIGLWVVYKAFFSFIEDPQGFSVGSVFIFITIGICLNRRLRFMNDVEVKHLLRNGLHTKRKFSVSNILS